MIASAGWDNLGDWRSATDFPGACEALAVRLGDAAELGAATTLLDVGCGAGAQLGVWCSHFQVLRGWAVEADPARARLAQARAPEGYAVAASLAELPPSLTVDAVLSLDAAYLFADRSAFFAEAYRRLRPGGVLALTDLAVTRPGRLAAGAARICGVPPSNVVSPAQYRAAVQAAGFEVERCDAIEHDVLAGFATWALRSRASVPERFVVTALVIKALLARDAVRYLLVVARRP